MVSRLITSTLVTLLSIGGLSLKEASAATCKPGQCVTLNNRCGNVRIKTTPVVELPGGGLSFPAPGSQFISVPNSFQFRNSNANVVPQKYFVFSPTWKPSGS